MKRGWQVMLVVTCMGCAGELRDPDRFAFLFDDDPLPDSGTATDASTSSEIDASMPSGDTAPSCVTALFQRSCGLTGCHSANAPQIDLASAGVESRLIGKASTSAVCRNRVYIATDGADSLLLQKLEDDPPCGDKMPIGPPLSSADRTCLTDWVESL